MRPSKECDWRDVTAKQYEEELVRDAFITGLTSPAIRQRLLENENLDLTTAVNQARALGAAHRNSQKFASLSHAASYATADTPSSSEQPCALAMTKQIRQDNAGKKCYFCSQAYHDKTVCPAKLRTCFKFQKQGHYAGVCKSREKMSRVEVIASFFM